MSGKTILNVMVIGDDPDFLMKKYDINKKVKPYKRFSYKDADKLKEKNIEAFSEVLKNYSKFNLCEYQKDFIQQKIKELNKMSSFEFYSSLVKDLNVDDNGDAWSDDNPNGKWTNYNIGNKHSTPLILYDNSLAYQSINKNIQWDKIINKDKETYELSWDLSHGLKTPKNEKESVIFENMKDKINYFSNFKDKEDYINYCCSFWTFAFLNEKGWKDMDDSKNAEEWIKNYYNNFISKLNPNDKVTIFEYENL